MDDDDRRLATAVSDYLEHVVHAVGRDRRRGDAVPFTRPLAAHLGTDPTALAVVTHRVDPHQHVNLDLALAALVAEHGGGEVLGIGGGDQRGHVSFGDMIQQTAQWGQFPVSAVERTSLPTGPDSTHQAITYGLHLFRYDGAPVGVLERLGSEYGRQGASVEIVGPEGVAERIVADVRRLTVELSVFRGQVLSLGAMDDAYTPSIGGIAFHRRPALAADDVVLPPGALDRIERHVAGTARHRDLLRAAGQHLKRGLLLYGPPGTGKTHTVRYLAGRLEGVTVVLLSGSSLAFVGPATELARALQPAVVVLEDVDLVAENRDLVPGAQPLLFTVLEAMDGLEGDADVAFVLTTNRADLLEPALAQRPGRVDLAVEVPLPDGPARAALARLYARDLGFTADALDDAAARTAGMTASFFKELVRRSVLLAAETGHDVGDADLRTALDELLDDREHLTRSLLGARGTPRDGGDDDAGGGADDGPSLRVSAAAWPVPGRFGPYPG